MESFYRESSGLPSTSIDSVKRFADKFGNYIYRNPAEKSSELYQPTEDNLRRAAYFFGYLGGSKKEREKLYEYYRNKLLTFE